MKKVLIITYYWPPASGPGVFRFLKFAKYLPEFGYEPVILTVKNGSYPSLDKSLLDEISPGPKVFKTRTIEPFALFNRLTGGKGKSLPVGIAPKKNDSLFKKWMFYIRANFFVPDARKGWNKFAFRKALEIIKKEKIKHVITTGPPHSTHLIGLKLKKKREIKWVADFRDPWTNIFYNETFPRTRETREKDFFLESSVLKNADIITTVSPGLKDEFNKRAGRIEIIPNGFDLEDIPSRETKETSSFVFSYIGNFKSTQNIEIIWKALSELQSEVEDFSENFTFRITGNCTTDVLGKLKEYELSDIVNIEGHVTHQQAIDRMVNSNLLLFIIPKSKNNRLILTGKLFEYLASCAPILSVGPLGGDADFLLQEEKRDQMLDYGDKEKFKALITDYFYSWKQNKKLVLAPKSDLSLYSRQGLTRKLANILESL